MKNINTNTYVVVTFIFFLTVSVNALNKLTKQASESIIRTVQILRVLMNVFPTDVNSCATRWFY